MIFRCDKCGLTTRDPGFAARHEGVRKGHNMNEEEEEVSDAEQRVEISPGGVGFIRTKASREIPGAAVNVKRKPWIDPPEEDQ